MYKSGATSERRGYFLMFSEAQQPDLCQLHDQSRKGDHSLPSLMELTINIVINNQGKTVFTYLFNFCSSGN